MASKLIEKTDDLVIHILNAFKHAKLNDESALNYIRKGCEAMCKILILQQKGEVIGIKIINGEINYKNTIINNDPKSLDFFNLIDTCKLYKLLSNKHKANESLYYKFEDLRSLEV
ncbi:hypothetical protein [Flavobacterium muglaense]|uniref:Uncharacterized protein n=1 Tax=Flavobacterium muglaense TaxID=2764716 RepID=A0A923N3L2_9FLAO|nr:hypothetical protein [Flavobacterium muglaense]MBC5839638.1 hypothetical protein [Flavobacterium muglaense]MBC5846165.1 hypothetical protein [Flavobacterium muglaense]